MDKYTLTDEEKIQLLKVAGANYDTAEDSGLVSDYDVANETDLFKMNEEAFNLKDELDFQEEEPLPSDPEYQEFHEKRTENIKKKDLRARENNTRTQRNLLLKRTDWLVQNDSPLNKEDLDSIKKWRQELRDAPDNSNWPKDLPHVPDIKEAMKAFSEAFGLQTVQQTETDSIKPATEEEMKALALEKDASLITQYEEGQEKLKQIREASAEEQKEKGLLELNKNKQKQPIFNNEVKEESEDKTFIKNAEGVWVHKNELDTNIPKRARDANGKFISDDPDTPDYNEAWEGGKAPEK
tara:strand:+ start:10153 stop:11040 length:888 start_codon:yes stop_codon:yes gene_type:complete